MIDRQGKNGMLEQRNIGKEEQKRECFGLTIIPLFRSLEFLPGFLIGLS